MPLYDVNTRVMERRRYYQITIKANIVVPPEVISPHQHSTQDILVETKGYPVEKLIYSERTKGSTRK